MKRNTPQADVATTYQALGIDAERQREVLILFGQLTGLDTSKNRPIVYVLLDAKERPLAHLLDNRPAILSFVSRALAERYAAATASSARAWALTDLDVLLIAATSGALITTIAEAHALRGVPVFYLGGPGDPTSTGHQPR